MAVTGIGGMFFRAKDPDALRAWYREHLAIGAQGMVWQQQAGPTVFMPFADTTDYWRGDRQWMLNLRVSDLDALVADLHRAGVAVATDPASSSPELGRFARLHDPEGNAIELWEPPA